MYRFEWNAIITEEFMNSLAQMAGVEKLKNVQTLVSLVEKIFVNAAGLRFVEKPLTNQEKNATAERILEGALRKLLFGNQQRGNRSGYLKQESENEKFSIALKPFDTIPINTATANTIKALPSIGKGLAKRIVETRISAGSFKSVEELAQRVSGIGEKSSKAISKLVSFDDPAKTVCYQFEIRAPFENLFTIFVTAQPEKTAKKRLKSALMAIATVCAADPHPYAKQLRRHNFFTPEPPVGKFTCPVGILRNTEYYYRIIEFLEEAKESIIICMFHIALPGEKHPTQKLLNAVATASRAGVDVKVLLDRDRDSDLYQSTVINTAAKSFFDANGVACRYDSAERLLHSKFIIIDDNISIVGSHNWSAGSYFQFDDLSLVHYSNEYTHVLKKRFDELWNAKI